MRLGHRQMIHNQAPVAEANRSATRRQDPSGHRAALGVAISCSNKLRETRIHRFVGSVQKLIITGDLITNTIHTVNNT
jgi:hypothetical protein